MIIPTAEYDPLFAEDGVAFRIKMIRYIEREFGDVLGPHRGLLRSDEGLKTLSAIHSPMSLAPSRRNEAA